MHHRGNGNAALERLRTISALPAGWDGHDSPPLQAAARAVAAQIASRIDDDLPAPHITPVRGGGVQFEWDHLGAHLEIEVCPDGKILYLFKASDGLTIDGASEPPPI